MYNHPRSWVYEQPEPEGLLVDEGERAYGSGSAYRIGVVLCDIIGIQIGLLDTLHTEDMCEVGLLARIFEGYVQYRSWSIVRICSSTDWLSRFAQQLCENVMSGGRVSVVLDI